VTRSVRNHFWTRPRASAWRRFLFQVHLWAGLLLALYVVVISLTGSAIVFREELEHAFRPHANQSSASPKSIDELTRLATKATGREITWIRPPDSPAEPLEIWFVNGSRDLIRYIDPQTGVLLQETSGQAVVHWLTDLHYNLLAGRTGRVVNAVGAAGLTLLAITGLVIWWPGVARWTDGLRVLWSARPARLNYDLHRAIGFWIFLLLLAWGLTGINFAFAKEFRAVVRTFLPMRTPQRVPKVEINQGLATVSYEALIRSAEQAVPESRTTWIRGLRNPKLPGLVYRVTQSDQAKREFTSVYLHPQTARVVAVHPPEARLAGDSFFYWLIRFHFGDFGGPGIKSLWVLLGLGPAFLAFTGILAWWYRVASKWRRRESTPAPKQLEETCV
jgi:uncharacterized iron-regulated membrane protein